MLPMICPWASKGGGCKCFYWGKFLTSGFFFFGGVLKGYVCKLFERVTKGAVDKLHERLLGGGHGCAYYLPFLVREINRVRAYVSC